MSGPPGAAAVGTGSRRGRGVPTLGGLATGMIALLAVEFLLGMTLALFVSLPVRGGIGSILASSWVLDLHILLALMILGISMRAVGLARAAPGRRPLIASGLALGSAAVATASGWSFAFDGQAPLASFTMALGFLGVLLGAVVLRGSPTGEGPTAGGSPEAAPARPVDPGPVR